ncbi:transcription attenuation protein MtrB [Paraliobacillus ryukyuensis]|uniref:Transcription attenuation protein MtrB n=1 Tax=Paraliobacillus ryukyuensis TaxID=200904 RepID=A0A366EJ70_9BACI|nr:trp RNA-binding attenuation protein MtrB [Paraliobacillus ryukyuensis]RBP01529.1 transcription attenuation protein (tryptophan RNA-binding attenuator protein) [Paraliobacillus ryukyuensis]
MQGLSQGDYFIIKALEDGVQVIGLTRGSNTKFHHAEKLDKNEMLVVQFTEHTSAIKIKGKAIIHSSVGQVKNDE